MLANNGECRALTYAKRFLYITAIACHAHAVKVEHSHRKTVLLWPSQPLSQGPVIPHRPLHAATTLLSRCPGALQLLYLRKTGKGAARSLRNTHYLCFHPHPCDQSPVGIGVAALQMLELPLLLLLFAGRRKGGMSLAMSVRPGIASESRNSGVLS